MSDGLAAVSEVDLRPRRSMSSILAAASINVSLTESGE